MKSHLSGRKLWIPAFAGMTHCRVALGWIDRYKTHVGRYTRRRFAWFPALAQGGGGAARWHGVGSFCLRFLFLGLLKQVKGRRHFDRGVAWTPLARLGGRGASLRKGEPGVYGASPGHEPRDRGPGEKTGRSIRRPARIRPLEEPEPVSSPMEMRTGASPSCLRLSDNPCL